MLGLEKPHKSLLNENHYGERTPEDRFPRLGETDHQMGCWAVGPYLLEAFIGGWGCRGGGGGVECAISYIWLKDG